ncbi:hypothetical protein [uncultured Tateyamaria sp.]|uniref:hypothetical protein n=1 Tax=uncultured Tateyamaria sp. TaxID=455651 RepID=UPI00262B1665|nr:hypothetical protein [uncultured Tateyamaria sp.]
MNRIKSAALTIAGTITALVFLGFFASVGLVLMGGLLALGAAAAGAAWVASWGAPAQETASA